MLTEPTEQTHGADEQPGNAHAAAAGVAVVRGEVRRSFYSYSFSGLKPGVRKLPCVVCGEFLSLRGIQGRFCVVGSSRFQK